MACRRISAIVVLMIACGAIEAAAQPAEHAPDCPQGAVAPPAEWAHWSDPRPLTAATRPQDAQQAKLEPGVAAKAALAHTPAIEYAARPAKPGGTVAFGGLFGVAIAEDGVYRVALGNASWVDMVSNGAAADSVAHGGGPACSGIRKIVDYDLKKGDYILQLSSGGDAETEILIVKRP